MNAVAMSSTAASSTATTTPNSQNSQTQSSQQHPHQLQQQQQHVRSQSDPTRNITPTCYHPFKTPESDFAKLAPSSLNISISAAIGNTENDDLFQRASLKKRKLNLDDLTEFNNAINNEFYDFKRSRTAPPSPPYELDADLKLKSPLLLNLESVVERARSLSPSSSNNKFLATPLPSSDVIEPPQQLNVPSSPISSLRSTVSSGSMSDYPDTCYKYTNAPVVLDSSNSEPYNEEWKQRLEILIKADNPVTYNHLKEYCNDLNKTFKTNSSNIDFDSRLSHKIKQTTATRLAKVISSRYEQRSRSSRGQNKRLNSSGDKMKISSIINFPFENNYTYQSSGYLQDIEMLNKNQRFLREQPSVNLEQYNYLFKNNYPPTSSVNAETAPSQPTQQQRRKSYISANPYSTTTDLPYNFNASTQPARHHDQHSFVSPPPQQQYQARSPVTSPAQTKLHTFVNSTPPQKYQQIVTPAMPTTRILPPTTPKSNSVRSPSTSPSSRSHHHHIRTCISCKSVHSPCWRPSWSIASGQLCNSCGLRYKKTGAHCLNDKCLRIPLKGEWTLMKNKGKVDFFDEKTNEVKKCYKCLHCGGQVAVNE